MSTESLIFAIASASLPGSLAPPAAALLSLRHLPPSARNARRPPEDAAYTLRFRGALGVCRGARLPRAGALWAIRIPGG